MSNPPAAASHIRYVVVFVTFLAAVVLYLHRFCISYAQQFIKEDLGLSDLQLSWCFSAFFIAYGLAQVPSGWLSDRFGARWMLSIYILAWSTFTATMGLTVGFAMLLAIRLAVGVSQAGAYPTSASLLGRWVPFSARGKANSFVAFGGRVGGLIAPLLTVYLVIYFVPVNFSSELRQEDFLEPRLLCRQLMDPLHDESDSEGENGSSTSEQTVRRRVASALSPTAEQLARQLAGQDGQTPNADSPDHASDRAAMEPIRRNLNQFLSREGFYIPTDFAEIKLEREAIRLAAAETRTASETLRLNRLLLQAVFPDSIRKIYVHGWRKVMFVYGGFGLLVAGLFWFLFRDRPEDDPRCNVAERKLIAKGRPASSVAKQGPVGAVPIRAMLTSRSLWLMCLNQFGGNIGWVFLMTWLPRYLLEVHDVPYVERGWMAAAPLAVGWLGMLLGGWLTDRVTSRLGLRWRTFTIVAGRFVAGWAYLACLFVPGAWAATAAFALISFSNDLCNPPSWAYKQDVGGRYIGAIHGWANMWGNFGAALSPVLLQLIISQYSWNGAFIVGAVAFFVAGTAAVGVDARIPIDRGD